MNLVTGRNSFKVLGYISQDDDFSKYRIKLTSDCSENFYTVTDVKFCNKYTTMFFCIDDCLSPGVYTLLLFNEIETEIFKKKIKFR